jgi:hypothetical protein
MIAISLRSYDGNDVEKTNNHRRGTMARPARIYIAYYVNDQPEEAEQICSALTEHFGADYVRSSRTMLGLGPAQKRAWQEATLDWSDIVILIAGPQWGSFTATADRQSAGSAAKLMYQAIRGAMRAMKPIIPVVVAGAQMPSPEDLPASIHTLARREECPVGDATFADDIRHIVGRIAYHRDTWARFKRDAAYNWPLIVAFAIMIVGLATQIAWMPVTAFFLLVTIGALYIGERVFVLWHEIGWQAIWWRAAILSGFLYLVYLSITGVPGDFPAQIHFVYDQTQASYEFLRQSFSFGATLLGIGIGVAFMFWRPFLQRGENLSPLIQLPRTPTR